MIDSSRVWQPQPWLPVSGDCFEDEDCRGLCTMHAVVHRPDGTDADPCGSVTQRTEGVKDGACAIDPSMLCDSCGGQMRWETSHSRCDRCGYIRPCCEGVPLEARPHSLPGSRA